MAQKYQVAHVKDGKKTVRTFTSITQARAFAIKELESRPRAKEIFIEKCLAYGLSVPLYVIYKESGPNGNEYYDSQIYKSAHGTDYSIPRVAYKNGKLGKPKW